MVGGGGDTEDLPFIILMVRSKGKERKCLFDDALNTFYLLLYGIGHMVTVKDHSE